MRTDKNQEVLKFELIPCGSFKGRSAYRIKKKRVLIGRSVACDIKLSHQSVSQIHAVLEITDSGAKIYDMDSSNGTDLNGSSVVVADVQIGDQISFGDFQVEFRVFNKSDFFPPPLDILTEEVEPPSRNALPERVPKFKEKPSSVATTVPFVEYPLEKDPKAEFSEYIFEDVEYLYPIFAYQPEKMCAEVIILHRNEIFSVDYLSSKDGVYSLVGAGNSSNKELSYPYLGDQEKIPFIEIKNGELFVDTLPGYSYKVLGKKDAGNGEKIHLNFDEIVKFSLDDIQVYVRSTEAPPKVDHAPVFRRDKEFKKYLFLVFLGIALFLSAASFYSVDEELEKEKAPERIATILYKKKIRVKKPPVIKNKLAKEKPKPKLKKKKVTKQKKEKIQKTKSPSIKNSLAQRKKDTNPKKATANKGPDYKKTTKVRPTKTRSKKSSSAASMKRSTRKVRVNNSKGNVDTYKSANFKSTISNLMSKGGSLKGASVSGTNSGVGSKGVSSGSSATMRRAKVSQNIGDLTGATTGKIDASTGARGIVNKKNVFTAGLPYRTVILGGMDPDTIRNILIQYIPQFRSCYEDELNRAKSAFDGVVKLNFIIGASGHVTRAGVDSYTKLPKSVRGCVVRVLRGIQFPEPLGGGVVEVNQPFNFYPKQN